MPHALVPVQLGAEWLLVDASIVQEILGPETWLPIPRARPELPGVLAWRGRAIPVVDLGPALGLQVLQTGAARHRTLIVGSGRSLAAVPVDSAREVHALAPQELRSVHAARRPYATAETELGGRLMPLIDLQTLLGDLAGDQGRLDESPG